jgi:hypothetical protein
LPPTQPGPDQLDAQCGRIQWRPQLIPIHHRLA